MATNNTNGATKAQEKTPAKTDVVLLPSQKPNLSNVPADPSPLEDRILKIQQLSDLIERREKIADALKKLSSFKFSSDGSRDSITIRDGKGNEFITSNSKAIALVYDTLKSSLQSQLSDTEAAIVF